MGTGTLLTAEEFEAHYAGPEHKRTELVHGEVREVTPASGPHGWMCANVLRHLDRHVDDGALGACFTEGTGFRLDADTVRSPDVSFVRAERLPDIPAEGFIPFAPDLAVEIVSPSERVDDVDEKLADYLGAGTRLVWIVSPRRRTVSVHAPDAPTRYLRESDTLDGGAVLPHFAVAVAALFKGMPGAA